MNSKELTKSKVAVVAIVAAVFLFLSFVLPGYRSIPVGDKIERSPTEMSERATELLRSFGYRERPAERWSKYSFEKTADDKHVVRFTERQSLDHFEAVISGLSIEPESAMATGERRVVLDSQGRLVELTVRFPKTYDSSEPPNKFDWNTAFSAAGLDLAAFTQIDTAWTPTAAADTYAAWTGRSPDDPSVLLRVEASTFRGQLTNFLIVYPWNEPEQQRPAAATTIDRLLFSLSLVALAAFAFAIIRVAWARSAEPATEERPAFLLALIIFITVLIGLLAATPQVPSFEPLLERLMLASVIALSSASLAWIIYFATARSATQVDTDLVASWKKLSIGAHSSQTVGNDVVIGVLAGAFISLNVAARSSIGFLKEEFFGSINGSTLSPFGTTLLEIGWAVLAATVVFGLFAFVLGLVRRRLIAGIILLLLLIALGWYRFGGNDTDFGLAIAISIILSFVAARFGLLTTIIAVVVASISLNALLAFVVTSSMTISVVLAGTVVGALLLIGVLLSLKSSADRDQRPAV